MSKNYQSLLFKGAPSSSPLSAIGMYLAFIYIIPLPLPDIDNGEPGGGKERKEASTIPTSQIPVQPA